MADLSHLQPGPSSASVLPFLGNDWTTAAALDWLSTFLGLAASSFFPESKFAFPPEMAGKAISDYARRAGRHECRSKLKDALELLHDPSIAPIIQEICRMYPETTVLRQLGLLQHIETISREQYLILAQLAIRLNDRVRRIWQRLS